MSKEDKIMPGIAIPFLILAAIAVITVGMGIDIKALITGILGGKLAASTEPKKDE